MSDDLIRRWDEYVESMGSVIGKFGHLLGHMSDRIEALERELVVAIEVVDESGKKRGEAEAKLAKAVDALRVISQFNAVTNNELNYYNIFKMTDRAHTVLAELEGKDE